MTKQLKILFLLREGGRKQTCLLIILGAVVLLAIISIFWLKGDQSQPTNIRTSSSPTSTIDTSEWIIFSNNKYGYSFEYPLGWHIYSSDLADVRAQPEKDIPDVIPGPAADAFEVVIRPNTDKISLNDYVKQQFQDIAHEESSITISGIQGIKVAQTEEAMGKGQPAIYLEKDNNFLVIKSNLMDLSYFQKILDSFKIGLLGVEKWKTYSNSQYTDYDLIMQHIAENLRFTS